MGLGNLRHGLGRALGHDPASRPTGLGSEIDDPIGALDHVEMVLDDEHGVARVDQPVQDEHEHPHVVQVQAGGGFVEDVEPASAALARNSEFPGDLEALRLSAREGRGWLAEPEVAESHLLELPERLPEARLAAKAGEGLVDGELEDIRDRIAADLHVEDFATVAGAAAGLAGHIHIGEKDHLDQHRAGAVAGGAAAGLEVE